MKRQASDGSGAAAGAAVVTAGKTNGNGSGGVQSPKALATREKNREAVRKCRQRKRERTEELKSRCDELSKENVQLRMRLELGNEAAFQEKLAKGKILIKEMQRLLNGMEGKLSDKERTPQRDALDNVYQQFFERHMELGPDKLSSLSFVVKRLHGLLEPDLMTKAYLFLLSQNDEFYEETPANSGDEKKIWWQEFCRQLNLTEEQKRQIKLRRLTGQRAKAELFYVAQRAQSMSKAILERKYLAQSFVDLMKHFTHAQLAKFVIWVSTDPCGNELLDTLYQELMDQIDSEFDKERAANEVSDYRALEVQQLLNAVRQENGRLFTSLFMLGDIRDSFRNARRIFTEDVVLIDPANGGEYRGLEQVMRYIDKMRRAFSPTAAAASPYSTLDPDEIGPAVHPPAPTGSGIQFEEKSLEFSGDKAVGKFHLSGTYCGRLLDEATVGAASIASGKVGAGVKVECETVVAITFAESSAKIKELLVSNDMMGLFKSIGQQLLNGGAVDSPSNSALVGESADGGASLRSGGGGASKSPRSSSSSLAHVGAVVAPSSSSNIATPKDGALFSPSTMTTTTSAAIEALPSHGFPSTSSLFGGFAKAMMNNDFDYGQDLDMMLIESDMEDDEIASLSTPRVMNGASASSNRTRKRQRSSSITKDNEEEQVEVASPNEIRKREHILTELRSLFEIDDQEEAFRLAERILADRCTFIDSNMGTDHRGIEDCYNYVKRIRSAFPRLKVVKESFERHVKPAGEPLKVEWLVEAAYGGRLASQQQPKPCTLRGTLFLVTDPEQGEVITNLAMSWNATSLLRELGVQLKDQRLLQRRPSTSAGSEGVVSGNGGA